MVEVSGTARCLRPLPRPHVAAGAEADVAAAQPGELGDPQAGLEGQHQQGVIAASGPAGTIRGLDQRVDLRCGEEGDDRGARLFR